MRPVRGAFFLLCFTAIMLAPAEAWGQQPAPCADLQAKVDSLQATLRRLQTQISQLEELLGTFQAATQPPARSASPAPAEAAASPAPAAPRSTPGPRTSSQRCAAITQKGTQCSRRASIGSSYCWQHQR